MKTLVRKNFAVIILALIAVFSFLMFSETGKVYADEPEIVPVVIEEANFAMVGGAAVRVQDIEDEKTNGLRFASTLSKTDYKGIMVNTNYSDIEFGVFIMPYDYIAEYGDLTEENLFGSQTKEAVYDWALWTENGWNYSGNKVRIINIYSNQMKESAVDGNYYLNASITGLLEENIARDFVSVGYIKYTEGGVVKYEMADYVGNNQRNSVRSMAYVAQKAIAYTGVDACDDDEKEYLAENYIAKSVVDNTAKDFGYVAKETSATAYTYTLAEGVTALRVTTSDADYTEVPFTCEDGVITISKSVVDAGLSVGALVDGENIIYIHTVDNSGAYPVYKVQEECLFVADVVLTQADVANLKTIIEANANKYIVVGEDLKDVVISSNICQATFDGVGGYTNAFTGTLDGRGHSITMKLGTGVYAFISNVVGGTVQNLYADIDRVSNEGVSTVANGSYVTGLVGMLGKYTEKVTYPEGSVNNCFVRYKFYDRGGNVWNDVLSGAVVGGLYTGTIKNCMSEMLWDGNLYNRNGAIVGTQADGDKHSIQDCYGVVNNEQVGTRQNTVSYSNGNTVARKLTNSGANSTQNPHRCGVYYTYTELFETGSTVIGSDGTIDSSWSEMYVSQVLSQAKAIKSLPAENGWAKFWSLENVDGDVLVKFGDVVIYNSAN